MLDAWPKTFSSPRFQQYLARWNEQGENLLVYIFHVDGRHHTFETSRKGDVYKHVDEQLSAFSARGAACDMRILFAEPMLQDMASAHATSAVLQFGRTSVHVHAPHIEVGSGVSGTRRVIVNMPWDVVRSGDPAGLLLTMDRLVANETALQSNWMRMEMRVDGGRARRHDLVLNDQWRRFASKIIAAAPWWSALANPVDYSLWLCGCKQEDVAEAFDYSSALRAFEMSALEASHLLHCSEIESPDKIGEMLSEMGLEVAAYLARGLVGEV